MSSKAREIRSYSFLVAYANDDTLDMHEVRVMKKLALEDGVIDEKEKLVLRDIFDKLDEKTADAKVLKEIEEFKKQFNI
jgi:uncharacterized membrane protein YebE (DUF533 family)